jgi:hypothetical protein
VPGARRAGTVRLDADLEVELDGHLATVSADGTHVRVRADQPLPVVRELRIAARRAGVGHASPARALGRVADELAAAGLTASVEGPHGPVLYLGGAGSRLGRWLTGSPSVREGAASGWRPVVRDAMAQAARSHRSLIAGIVGIAGIAAAVAAATAGVVRRRRRS